VPDPRPVLLVTRPEPQASRFAAEVEARCPGRFDIVLSPLMDIAPVVADVDVAGAAALVFTSESGVRVATARWGLAGRPAFCVGDRTAAAALDAGLAARSAAGDVDDLVTLVTRDGPRDGRILHLRGRHRAGQLVERLRAAGLAAEDVVIYAQVARPLTAAAEAALSGAGPVLAPLFSPRTADLFGEAVPGAARTRVHPVCLSAAVRAALPADLAARAETAARPDGAAMLELLAGWK